MAHKNYLVNAAAMWAAATFALLSAAGFYNFFLHDQALFPDIMQFPFLE